MIKSIIFKDLQFICETANTKESDVINGYKSHVYKREDLLRHEQTIAMIIELNHGIPGFDNDEIKDILYYISTISILILSIWFYFNKCTVTDQIDCVYVWIKMFYNNWISRDDISHTPIQDGPTTEEHDMTTCV